MNDVSRIAAIFALLFATANAARIDDAEQALQARQFESAITLLQEVKDSDYANYLKAIALYQSGKHADAVSTCEELLKQHPDSQW